VRAKGEKLKKYSILAQLDDREAQAKLSELRAREKFLGDEVDRYRILVKDHVASLQAYERIVSTHAQAQAVTRGAIERLSYYMLRSPLAGTVLRRDGEVGKIVKPGDVLFWVGSSRPLRIVAEVDEEDIPQVRLAQRTLIKSDAFPNQALEGSVEHITPKGEWRTNGYCTT